MNNIMIKLQRFLKERYKKDELYKFLITLCIVIIILNIFIKSRILDIVQMIILAIAILRYLSKDIKNRKRENEIYLDIKIKVLNKYNYQKRKFKDRNTHIYRKCPKCHQKIRLPRKKGVHTAKCPNCGNSFKVKCKRDEKIKVEIVK